MIHDDLSARLQIMPKRVFRIAVMRRAMMKIQVILPDIGINEMIETQQRNALFRDRV